MLVAVMPETPLPDASSGVAETLIDWLRSKTPAYITVQNPEGNPDDGIIIVMNDILYLGYNPSAIYQNDYVDWRPIEACTARNGHLVLQLGKKVNQAQQLMTLNLFSPLTPGEYARV